MSVRPVAHTPPPPPPPHVEAAPKPAPVKTESHSAPTEARGNKVNKSA